MCCTFNLKTENECNKNNGAEHLTNVNRLREQIERDMQMTCKLLLNLCLILRGFKVGTCS